MNYGEIKNFDIANGEGVRVSLFVSGCTHHCKNCFNKETWDFSFGKPFTAETEALLLKELAPDYINGLSLLGGEPFEPENQQVLAGFLQRVRAAFPHKDIWCYTGHTYDTDLAEGGCVHTDVTDDMLSCIDLIVDGEFIEEQKDITLLFRGSRIPRLIPLHGYKAPQERKRTGREKPE